METENVVLMKMAQGSLKEKWGLAIGTCLVYGLIIGGIQIFPFVGPLVSFFISGPMAIGLAKFSLSISRNEDARLEQIFDGFNNYGTALGAYFLTMVFTLLWMLLLIVPGIMAALSYSLTFFIIAEDNNIGAMEAIDKSKMMMDGYKMKMFLLGLRFFGLALLCILTLGIGFLWWFPYMKVTMVKFYEDVKSNKL
jgi:uncharacterized membrane protein